MTLCNTININKLKMNNLNIPLIQLIDSEFYNVQQNIEINNEISKIQQIGYIDEEIEKLKNMKEQIEIVDKENQEINKYFIKYVQIIINN